MTHQEYKELQKGDFIFDQDVKDFDDFDLCLVLGWEDSERIILYTFNEPPGDEVYSWRYNSVASYEVLKKTL